MTQYTSENWDNVSLTLSTTRPTGTTAAPDLTEQEVAEQRAYDKVLRNQAAAPAPSSESDAEMADELGAVGGAIAKPKLEERRMPSSVRP